MGDSSLESQVELTEVFGGDGEKIEN